MTLREAIRAHQLGHLSLAEPLYRKALQLQAGQPDTLHFLGVLCHQRGRSDEGAELIRAALQAIPRHPDAHNNLGNIHKECGRLAEAEACYRLALGFAPSHIDAWINLAIVLEAMHRSEDALGALQQLLERAPRLARAHYLMGTFVRDHVETIDDVAQALPFFRSAIQCDPGDARARRELGVVLYIIGRQHEAIEVYRDWHEREPANPVPRHMLAACGGEVAPERADDAYVRETFDSFADSFDEQLLNNLDYRAPQILVDALVQVLGAARAALDVLDAGCGTGLCGPLIRPHARRLDGVDLSPRMIDKARRRGDYDALDVAELTAHLQQHTETWDVVVSADTLIYFGDLSAVLEAACNALRPGGWLAFTLEVLEGDEQHAQLSASGRYRHTRHYVEDRLGSTGFVDARMEAQVLRKEVGRPVFGWVVLARKRRHGT